MAAREAVLVEEAAKEDVEEGVVNHVARACTARQEIAEVATTMIICVEAEAGEAQGEVRNIKGVVEIIEAANMLDVHHHRTGKALQRMRHQPKRISILLL